MFFIFVIYLFLSVGCSQESNNIKRAWFETKEEAIKHGLKEEGRNRKTLLSIQEIDNETIVIYEFNSSLGIASLTKGDKGFSWFRGKPYLDLAGEEIPYSTAWFEYETESGLKIPILIGKAFDESIIKMKLIEKRVERELNIIENSRWFFEIDTSPYSSMEVIPINK